MKIGIIRETKTPPDRRVPFTPWQCMELMEAFTGVEVTVQPDNCRCFSNSEYEAAGISIMEDISNCDVLMGVKEVKMDALIDNKTYLFFSHTAKMQSYNRDLLKEILRKKIRLIDYEYLTREDNTRVVAFGRWAGIVGAYSGLRAYGLRNRIFELKPAVKSKGLNELKNELVNLKTGNVRIILTGGGRVAGGAMEILDAAGIKRVTPEEYLVASFNVPVYAQLDPWHYARPKNKGDFSFEKFLKHPEEFENNIREYIFHSDIFIACHFWDPKAPIMVSTDMIRDPDFPVKVIADISCDINGPIASTIRASTIAEPFYGYDLQDGVETEPFQDGSITIMAVDNLPGELPRDASEDFGNALVKNVIPALLGIEGKEMIAGATIAEYGKLTDKFAYLQDFVDGE